jgi:hypothetical protein
MAQKFQTIINREARGYILKVLKISYPRSVNMQTLDVCLVDAGMPISPGELCAFLDYLVERKYIEVKKRGIQDLGGKKIVTLMRKKQVFLLAR